MVALVKFDFDLWWQHRKKNNVQTDFSKKINPKHQKSTGDKKDLKSEGLNLPSGFNSLYSHLNLDCTMKHVKVVIEAAVS